MRVAKPHKKELEKVTIPSRLLKFLSGVYKDILSGDESTQIESDDLLQDDFVFGGLLEKGGDEYSFCYFPTAETEHTWSFTLSKEDLKNISDGKISTLDLWSCRQDGCQSKFETEDQNCFYHDYIEGEE